MEKSGEREGWREGKGWMGKGVTHTDINHQVSGVFDRLLQHKHGRGCIPPQFPGLVDVIRCSSGHKQKNYLCLCLQDESV